MDAIELLKQTHPYEFQKPDFEDASTNYFYDEASVKAGNQLQKDAWNAAIDQLKKYVNEKGMVQFEEFDRFKL